MMVNAAVNVVISRRAPVAQLDRASDFESAGRPFESGRVRHLSLCFISTYRFHCLNPFQCFIGL
jgi:hypothetical protein